MLNLNQFCGLFFTLFLFHCKSHRNSIFEIIFFGKIWFLNWRKNDFDQKSDFGENLILILSRTNYWNCSFQNKCNLLIINHVVLVFPWKCAGTVTFAFCSQTEPFLNESSYRMLTFWLCLFEQIKSIGYINFGFVQDKNVLKSWCYRFVSAIVSLKNSNHKIWWIRTVLSTQHFFIAPDIFYKAKWYYRQNKR